MGRSIRTAISVGFVGLCLWGAFAIPLGDKTLAEHIDAIGETPEADALLDGARGTVNPALEEFKDRILGEHVTAPTHLAESPTAADDVAPPTPPGAPEPALSGSASTDDEPSGIYASDGGARTIQAPPVPSRPVRDASNDAPRLPGMR